MESTVIVDGVRYELDRTKSACKDCAADKKDVCNRMPECQGHSWKLHESQPADEWQGYGAIKYVPSATQELKAFFGNKEFPSEAEEEHFKALDEKLNQYDVVEKPKHYMLFEDQGIEVRDVIEKLVEKLPLKGTAWLGHSGMFVSDYVQLMQYLMRFMDKNGVEDLKKARWYLDKMIGSYGKI